MGGSVGAGLTWRVPVVVDEYDTCLANPTERHPGRFCHANARGDRRRIHSRQVTRAHSASGVGDGCRGSDPEHPQPGRLLAPPIG